MYSFIPVILPSKCTIPSSPLFGTANQVSSSPRLLVLHANALSGSCPNSSVPTHGQYTGCSSNKSVPTSDKSGEKSSGLHSTVDISQKTSISPTPKIPNEPNPNDNEVQTPIHYRIPRVGMLIDYNIFKIKSYHLAEKYGPVYLSDVGGRLAYILTDLAAINVVSRDAVTFVGRDAWPESVANAIGYDHLSNLDGREHSSYRRMVTPIFAPVALSRSQAFMTRSAKRMWLHAAIEAKEKGTVTLSELARNHFLRGIIFQTFGENNLTDSEQHELVHLYDKLIKGLFSPSWLPEGKGTREARVKLLDFISDVLSRHFVSHANDIVRLREIAQQNSKDNDNNNGSKSDMPHHEDVFRSTRKEIRNGEVDLLTMLCAMSDICPNSEMASQADKIRKFADKILFLWFAGATTSPAPCLSAVMQLGQMPETLAKLREEQKNVTDEDLMVFEVRQKMPLLTSFIEEVLRLFPPVSGYVRVSSKLTSILGHRILKNKLIYCDVYAAQRNEKYYPDPHEFKADRFLNGDAEPIVAFGASRSVHQCIGLVLARINLVSTIAVLIREYDFELDPNQDFDIVILPELRPKSGVNLTRIQRNNDFSH